MLDCRSMETKDRKRELRKAARNMAKWQIARDEQIRQAAGEGWTVRAIADQVGVSFQRVFQIVQRDREAS